MNLNTLMMQAFHKQELSETPLCIKCIDEANKIAKKTIGKERKLLMRECGNNKETMKAFEEGHDVSRFVYVKCPTCRVMDMSEANRTKLKNNKR